MRPFDILRAAFYLLAAVVLIQMAETLIAVSGCFWVVVVQGRQQMGGCQNMAGTVREIFTELLTAILALLAASRTPPPPPGPGNE